MFVDAIDRDAAETIVEHLQASDAPMRVAQLRVLGGAMARVPVEATAFAHRHSRIMVNVAAFYDGPADRAVRQAWVSDFAAALRQEDTGAYVNFLGDEGQARVREAYPGPTWDRLAAVKASLRPDQPVPPQPEHPPGDPETRKLRPDEADPAVLARFPVVGARREWRPDAGSAGRVGRLQA